MSDPAGAAWADAPAPFHRTVFDPRFEESAAFADALRRTGIVTVRTGSDIARLWYDDLHARMTGTPPPIAGLTDRATLFCLEELARSAGMSVVYRIDHLIDARGRVVHDPAGPAAAVAAAHTLARGPGFGRQVAALISRNDAPRLRNAAAMKRTGPFAPEGKVALVSWVMA